MKDLIREEQTVVASKKIRSSSQTQPSKQGQREGVRARMNLPSIEAQEHYY